MWRQNGTDKQCVICGKLLVNVAPGTKYCPECRETVYKSAHDGDRKRRKQARSLADAAKKAADVGMSYGQYIAKYGDK